MNKETILKTLQYAKNSVQHPENRKYTNFVYTDGIQVYNPPNVKQLKEQFEARLKIIEEYEEFMKNIDELIKENAI